MYIQRFLSLSNKKWRPFVVSLVNQSLNNQSRFTAVVRLVSTSQNPPSTTTDSSLISRSTSATLGADTSLPENRQEKPQPTVLFPWRHSPELLTRLVPSSPQYDPTGLGDRIVHTQLAVACLYVLAGCQLNWSWYDILIGKHMQQSLAQTCALAFCNCVGCLVSHRFQIPLDTVIDSSMGAVQLEMMNTNTNTNEQVSPSSSSSSSSSPYIVDAPTLQDMLDPALLSLYQPIKSSSTSPPLNILLDMQIESARLENLHVIPFLTRDDVKHHPQYQFALRKIMLNISYNQSRGMSWSSAISNAVNQLDELEETLKREETKLTGKKAEEYDASFTIVAQVLVKCQERFRVVDVNTGTVIQGHPEAKPQTVCHLVRFEMVQKVKFRDSVRGNSQLKESPWKITDWDDLLEGNLWH